MNHATLNERQKRFLANYLVCANATKAALAAGYSKRTAYSQGQRLLKKLEIASAIAERTSSAAMKADQVLAELSNIAGGRYETFRRDKVRSLELLARYHGLLSDIGAGRGSRSMEADVDQAAQIVRWAVSLANCDETKAAHARGENISLEFALSTLAPANVDVVGDDSRGGDSHRARVYSSLRAKLLTSGDYNTSPLD